MKAVVCTRYGPPGVLQLQEVPKPVPNDSEMLVRVRATTVTSADVMDRSFTFPPWLWPFARASVGFTKPRNPILGFELAGDVESTGKDVESFKEGDKVFASTFEFGFGCYAEYRCLPQDGAAAIKPANMTYEEAAADGASGKQWWVVGRRLTRGSNTCVCPRMRPVLGGEATKQLTSLMLCNRMNSSEDH